MSEMQTIQWFPGHMTKTKRQIQSSLKLVDAVAEIIDARIPISSRNPDLNKLIQRHSHAFMCFLFTILGCLLGFSKVREQRLIGFTTAKLREFNTFLYN